MRFTVTKIFKAMIAVPSFPYFFPPYNFFLAYRVHLSREISEVSHERTSKGSKAFPSPSLLGAK